MGREASFVRIRNVTRGVALAERAETADSFWRRGVGLIGRRDWNAADALIITPSNSVHSWFMRMTIDVVHLTADGVVQRLVPNLRPWRFGPIVRGGRTVIELPAGTIERTGTAEGDQIAVERV